MVRSTKITFDFSSAPGDHSDLKVFVVQNVTKSQLKTLFGREQFSLGYLIRIIPAEAKEGAIPEDVTTTALLHVAMAHNVFCREISLDSLNNQSVHNDLENAAHLVLAPESLEEKTLMIKRFIQCQVFEDEFSRIVAENLLARKNSVHEHGLTKIYSVCYTTSVYKKADIEHLRFISNQQNELWMKMASDCDFILQTMESFAKTDSFLSHLYDIAKKVRNSPHRQTAKLCYSRNDFFLDESGDFKQVEPNMWAVGCGAFFDNHKKILSQIETQFGNSIPSFARVPELPTTIPCFTEGLEAAWRYYSKPEAIIVLVTQKHENVFDQFAPAQALASKGITYIRYSLDDLVSLLEVDPNTGIATVLGKEVGVFFYRDGFLPDFYNEKTWIVREQIELSRAIKAPNIFYQLANTKYMQHLMSKPEIWLRFGYSQAEYEVQSKTFSPSFCVSDFDSKESLEDYILQHGGWKEWVLKPQRDGGCNNFFGEEIKPFFLKSTFEELKPFILHKKIHVVSRTGIFTNWKSTYVRELDDELGLYHYILSDNDKKISEKEGGISDKAKVHQHNEVEGEQNLGGFSRITIRD